MHANTNDFLVLISCPAVLLSHFLVLTSGLFCGSFSVFSKCESTSANSDNSTASCPIRMLCITPYGLMAFSSSHNILLNRNCRGNPNPNPYLSFLSFTGKIIIILLLNLKSEVSHDLMMSTVSFYS